MATTERKRLTVRIAESKLNRLDDAIWRCKMAGEIDRDTSRSDVVREHLDELIEDLEERAEAAETDQ